MIVMVSEGVASHLEDVEKTRGKYLQDMDADANDGRGSISWTDDISKAKGFSDVSEALAFWRTRSKVTPTRDDGRPNCPLTAYSVRFVTRAGEPYP